MIHTLVGVGAGEGASQWLWDAMTSPLMLKCLGLAAVAVIGLLLCLRAMWRLGRRGRKPAGLKALATDGRGTAVMEFALVFPIALFLILLLTQTTLVMIGNLYVHYSAFAATRAAIVQIPADYVDSSGEAANFIDVGGEGLKFQRIRDAAVFAVQPVCGRVANPTSPAPTTEMVSGLKSFYTAYGRQPPHWIDYLTADRLNYANTFTWVRVYDTRVTAGDPPQATFLPIEGSHVFGPRDPVTVEVRHNLNLSIPYVRGIFADGGDADHTWSVLTARYTLTNEGVDRNLPPIPRNRDGEIIEREP